MPHSAASDQGLHCLPVTSLGVSSLHWVNCDRYGPQSISVHPVFRLVKAFEQGGIQSTCSVLLSRYNYCINLGVGVLFYTQKTPFLPPNL